MKTTCKKSVVTAEHIAKTADEHRSVANHFTNRGKMMPAVLPLSKDNVAKESVNSGKLVNPV